MDVALVNGGLQPIIRMTPNVPQLWRMWNAQWKVRPVPAAHSAIVYCHVKVGRRGPAVPMQGYMDLNIIHNDGLLAPCKFHLMTKDGVYLMEIPRLVDDLVMAAANR